MGFRKTTVCNKTHFQKAQTLSNSGLILVYRSRSRLYVDAEKEDSERQEEKDEEV
jgi:hypothetical protein